MYPIVFVKLDGFSMRHWDESMYAVNVYEMMGEGELIVPYYRGEPDIRNTKPPLVMWMQMGLAKVMGYGPLAMRLPSALAVVASVLLLFRFTRRHLSDLGALLASGVLITSFGYITFHTGRTGDPDAMMALFVLLANVSFLSMLYEKKIRPAQLYAFFIFLALGFWCKSLAALLFIPGYIVLTLMHRKLSTLLRNSHFWMGGMLFILLCVGFLWIRESAQPGYLSHFFGRDAGRVLIEIEGQAKGFWFYVWNMLENRFTFWFPFLIVGIIWSLFEFRNRRFWLYRDCAILILTYWLIISVSITKLSWYDINLYPLAAIMVAMILVRLVDLVKGGALRPALLMGLFILPYAQVYSLSQVNSFSPYEIQNEAKERYLHKRIGEGENLDGLKVYHHGYRGALLFYKYWLHESEQEIELLFSPDFESGDEILISRQHDDVLRNYRWVETDSADFVHRIRIE